jgi:23S rRNA (uracil1939-C5)-methyltransferase
MKSGDRLTLKIEKPAAGGRMIARHEGFVVLVGGAIPGEVVEAEVERVQRSAAWARTARVLEPSADRVDVGGDWACGGNVLAHVTYQRQKALKREIIQDAFARIGRMNVPADIDVAESPSSGYRMRARLHVVNGRIGFFREGTHDLCDAAASQQLLPASVEVLRDIEEQLAPTQASAIKEIELSENCAADERALHLTLRDESDPSRLGVMPSIRGVRGVSCGAAFGGRPLVLAGTPDVSDTLEIPAANTTVTVTLTRQAHAFFQGNRYLLSPLVTSVVASVPKGHVLDLYAGVGLFSVALAARGDCDVIAIEGERVSAHDLKHNAARVGAHIEPRHQSVEAFLRGGRLPRIDTVVVDPPRTGMTKDALHGALALRPARLIYVSCDVATLARDARTIVDGGYRLSDLRAFDLFPNTAHVETLVIFEN